MPRGPLDAARQWLLFAGAYYVYRLVRGLVDGHANVAYQHARDIVDFERDIHTFFETDLQRWAIDHSFFIHAADWMYVNSHFLVTTTFLIWLYTARNHAYYFVRNMFLVAMVFALVGRASCPSGASRTPSPTSSARARPTAQLCSTTRTRPCRACMSHLR
jgi:hypothetical protein